MNSENTVRHEKQTLNNTKQSRKEQKCTSDYKEYDRNG